MARVHGVRWLAVAAGIGVIFICGVGCGGLLSSPHNTNGADTPLGEELKPSPIVIRETVTHTEYVLTQPCKQALLDVQKVIQSATNISAAHSAQLDIMERSFNAILMKDWKKLNELTDDQRDLDRRLAGDKVALLPSQSQVQKEIKECVDSAPRQ